MGIVTDIVQGTGGLVIGVIVVFVIVGTLLGAGLLTSGSAEATSAGNLSSNLTAGINNVATKIPTILLIAGVVLLFGVIVVLVSRARQTGLGGGGSL